MPGSHTVKESYYSCILEETLKVEQKRDYVFQALRFSACIFTSFNSLSLSTEVLALQGNRHSEGGSRVICE